MADLVAACSAFIRSPDYWDATPRQIVLLGILCDQPGPHEVRHLAEQMSVTKPVITRATNKLVAMGMAWRWQAAHDKRLAQIIATETGARAREAMRSFDGVPTP